MRPRLYPQFVTVDDRGRQTPMHVLSTRELDLKDPRVMAVRRRINECMQGNFSGVGLACGLIVPFGGAIVRSITGLPNTFAGSLVVAGFLLPLFWLLGLASRAQMQKWMPAFSAVLVKDGLCGACAYNLHGLEADTDGCIACPECGAAWQHARIKRSAPLDDRPLSVIQQFGLTKEDLRWHGFTRMDRRRGTDDLGLPVQLVTLAELESISTTAHRLANRASTAASAIRAASEGRRRAIVMVSTAAVIIGVAGALSGPELLKLPLLLIAGAAALAAYLAVRTDIVHNPATIIAAAKAAAICPACAHDLQLAVDSSGEPIECPKCGAAWNLMTPLPATTPA